MKPASFHAPKRIEHEGAPLVYMSPTKPARNLNIIYEAIKDLPDSTVLQADHDTNGRPYVFFPGQNKTSKKKDPVQQQNLNYYRHELGHILDTSMTAAKKNEGKSFAKTDATAAKKLQKIATFTPSQGDFTVGQLKPVLGKMVNVNKPAPADTPAITAVANKPKSLAPTVPPKKDSKTLQGAAKPARDVPKKSGFYYDIYTREKLRTQRLNCFTLLSPKERLLIKAALFRKQSTVTALEQDQAINAMQKLVTDFIEQTDVPAKPLQEFIQESNQKKELECFSRHWLAAINAGKRSSTSHPEIVLRITIFNWTPEIQAITEDIVKNFHHYQRVLSGRSEKLATHIEKKESYEEDSSLVESSSEESSSVSQKDSPKQKRIPSNTQTSTFKKLNTDAEDEALLRILNNPTIEEVGRDTLAVKDRPSISSSLQTNSSTVITTTDSQSSTGEVMMSEFIYQQPLRQSQWSMPIIQGLEDYLSSRQSLPDMSEADRSAAHVLDDLLKSLKENFQQVKIYQASSTSVTSLPSQSEQGSEETSLFSETTSAHQENLNQ